VLTNSGTETVEAALKHAYLERPGRALWAIHNAFHGTTLAAIQLTEVRSARFKQLGPEVRFLDPWDATSWKRHEIEAEDISAAIIEPILGEGGIVPVPDEFLLWLRQLCYRNNIPFIVDEIQTGLGRTGLFLASQALRLDPDYICLSKALGGGITKIGALLVKRERLIGSFSLLHSSTFAGDDISCRVACKVLEIINRDDVPGRCEKTGQHLLQSLVRLRNTFPDQIRDVRGRGLLVGIEFEDVSSGSSNLLRAVASHGLFGMLASAYFLKVHNIRVFPSLSNPSTLRVEPSSFVKADDLDRFVAALGVFCDAVRTQDLPHLIGHLVGRPRPERSYQPRYRQSNREMPDTHRRAAFIAHIIRPEDLTSWDSGLAEFESRQLSGMVSKVAQVMGPAVYDELHVHSPMGRKVHLSMIGLFYTSAQLFDAYRSRQLSRILEQIDNAVDLARRRGCRIAGLGGFLSIIASNGLRIRNPRIGLTSGNALTVGMGTRALADAAERVGIDPVAATLGVVGATGNIAQAYALSMADRVRGIVLITRRGGGERCRPLVNRLAEISPGIQVTVSESLEALRSCSLIVAASNSPGPLIYPRHLGSGPIVICDISLPADVASEVGTGRGDVTVINGGVVQLPADPDLNISGLSLAPGHVFACMAETLLMGLEDVEGHGSYGPVTAERVRWALEMADKHHFKMAKLQVSSLLSV
jgi:acetylornithine/succinyldiaminopimelate/putrescine aminotransferase/predicted amino acid dehydrogenase